MTDEKSQKPGEPKDLPVVTEEAKPKSNFAKAAADKGKTTSKKASGSNSGDGGDAGTSKPDGDGSGRGWLWFLLVLVLLGGAGAWGWFYWPPLQTGVERALAMLPGSDSEARGTIVTSAPASRPATATGDAGAAAAGETAPDQPGSNAGEPAPRQSGEADDAPGVPGEPRTDSGAAADPTPADSTPDVPESTAPPATAVSPGPGGASTDAGVSTPPPTPREFQTLEDAASQAQALADARRELNQQRTVTKQLRQQVGQLQRELAALSSRLGELGNVSRTDWQLAEADYLLRLANQRLLLERDSRAALGLLEEVDRILSRLDRPDLYGVRQQLARDITELKMAEDIDQQGLYLRLGALQEQMLNANIQPEFDLALGVSGGDGEESADAAEQPAWQRSWDQFTDFLSDSIRIRDGDIDPVLLSPQSETRFRQSLRLDMEQAQLAVLRGETRIYREALDSARQSLLDYAIPGQRRDTLVSELEQLVKQPIEADLPDLNASQRALQDYIEQLHNTAPAPAGNGGTTP